METLSVRKMLLWYIWISFCVIFVCLQPLEANSLWNAETSSTLYTSKKPYKVGHIITVYISESTSAAQEAGTNTSSRSKMGANLLESFNAQSLGTQSNESRRQNLSYGIGSEDRFQGVGKTTRKSNVKSVVSVTVSEVLPNGNLVISGDHRVEVNGEMETIQIKGEIRPQDISAKNAINSYQLANTQISVKGKGVVGEKQEPGLLSKLFGWLL